MKRLFIYMLFLYLGNALLFPSLMLASTLRVADNVGYNYDAGKLRTPDWLEYPFVAQPGNGSYIVKLEVLFHFDIWNNGAFDLILFNMDTNKETFCKQDYTLTKFPAGTYLFRLNYSNATSSAVNYKMSMIISETRDKEGFPPMGGAEPGSLHNYILSKTFTTGSGSESLDIINYYDGFGRLEQTVAKEASPTRNDLITLVEYNRYGQQTHEWLPAVLDNGGAFTKVDVVKASAAYWNEDSKPYTKTEYEISPLHTPIKSIGYGEQWHEEDKGVETAYFINRTEIDTDWDLVADIDFGTWDYSDMQPYNFIIPAHSGPVTHTIKIKITFPFSFYPSISSPQISVKNLDTGENRIVNSESETIWTPGHYVFRIDFNNTTANEMHGYGSLYIVYTGNYADLPLPFEDSLPRTIETPFLRCNRYKITATGLQTMGEYEDGELYVTKITGEEGQASYQFVNKKGQKVLIREINGNQLYDTYYVYDDFGNIGYVLPPLAVEKVTDYSDNDEIMEQYAYIYKYDSWNRCISKKLPGCEPICFIYDKADRPIFTQDGEMRKKGQWLFNIPDALGRSALTGVCKNDFSAAIHEVNESVITAKRTENENSYKGYIVSGVTLLMPELLTVNYYDNYSFLLLPEFFEIGYQMPEEGYGSFYMENSKGLLIGIYNALAGSESAPLVSAMFYDDRGRLIQTQSLNHTGGKESEYTGYDFVGNPLQTKLVHTAVLKGQRTTRTELFTYAYDHASRLLQVTHQLNDRLPVILAENLYDQYGRLALIKVNGNDALQTSFNYNIRSWMKKIGAGNFFTEELNYTPSGNISEMQWSHGSDKHVYQYTYDDLSRLVNATYSRPTAKGSSYSSAYSSAYGGTSILNQQAELQHNYNTAYTYDKQGNIQTLIRHGRLTESPVSYGMVDELVMAYRGNQLIQVKNSGLLSDITNGSSFKDFTGGNGEYLYNANGSLIKDSHKGIVDIQYNFLNLPQQIDIKSPVAEARNEYLYSATGVKLRVTQRWNPDFDPNGGTAGPIDESKLSEEKVTDYIGNKIYENDELKRILVPGGYYDEEKEKYFFYLSDHLGNNRVVIDEDGEVIQQTHYYPFGSTFAESTGENKQPYKYNGKELDSKHGLNLYDYSARYYEPAIGRFTTMDPLTEEYYSISPYAYCANNPIRFIDPDGRTVWDYIVGVAHSIGSNLSLGTMPTSTRYVRNAFHYNKGRDAGDVVSMGMGAAEVNVGGNAATLGLAGTGLSGGTSATITASGMVVINHGLGVMFHAANSLKTGEGRIDVSEQGSTPTTNVKNPHGSKGKPDHQQKVSELEAKMAKDHPDLKITTEKKIQVDGSNRRPDVQGVDPKTEKTKVIYEAERNPGSKRNLNREAEYKQLGIENETFKVGK